MTTEEFITKLSTIGITAKVIDTSTCRILGGRLQETSDDEEIGEIMGRDLDRVVDHRLKTQSTYIWEDNLLVSLAAGRQRSPTVGLIGSVYTPPEHCRKGYATACVAALSQKLLNEGCDRCFLLTDLANPTSNHIYQQIGYIPVCDWYEYSFIFEDNDR